MFRFLALCLLLLGLAAPALAQWEGPFTLEDPLARRIVSTCSHDAKMLGPYDAQVSIFSVPEPDGSGNRLYVGFVDDIYDRQSPARLWRGPAAVWWQKLRPVPEYTRRLSSPNPARYRIERLGDLTHSGRQTSVMEIDLEAKPAQLRLVGGGPDQPKYLDSQPLEELPMNDSLRLITRLSDHRSFSGNTQRLHSYKLYQGHAVTPVKRPPVVEPWDSPMDTHLLAVSLTDNPAKHHVFFLPMRPFGWEVEKHLSTPGWSKTWGNFVLQMVASYLVPNEIGELTALGSRHRVSVGFSGLFITTMEMGLVYDGGNEQWVRKMPTEKGKAKAGLKPKP
jgi:hypothetical protein